MNLSVFILAAGLGERLRPITEHIPKPLLPVLGKPVLESVLEKVSPLSADRTGINLHYKQENIQKWIDRSAYGKRITVFPENPVLGTGGALKNAEEFLRGGLFLIHNADILSDIDLGKLIAFHKESGNIATLAVHNFPEFNNLVFDDNSYLLEIGAFCSLCRKPGTRLLAFTGIAVYAPDFLNFLPEGASSVVHAWTQALSAGQKIGAYDVSGCSWTDIGTPVSYAKAVLHALRSNGEMVYIHPSVESCGSAEIDGYTVIEQGSTLLKGVSLRNCIVLPGTSLGQKKAENSEPECFLALFWGKGREECSPKLSPDQEKSLFENCILGPDFSVPLSESALFGSTNGGDFPIGTGGSDRKYYRTRKNENSFVIMQCTHNDPDFQRHLEYTKLFRRYAVPVPEIIEADPEKMIFLLEDVGDMSLYSWLKCPRNQEEIEGIYMKVLDILVSIHTTVTRHISECPLLQNRNFDYDHFRWESNYFLERFVKGFMDCNIEKPFLLENELHNLALTADSLQKTVLHRDFQSQNIMIMRGGIPRLLDFQGARMGPPAYDLVSLLWDPYLRLEHTTRARLFEYYIQQRSGMSEGFSDKIFRETVLPCRLQRHMQALGAYAFLSLVKGKKYFSKYIPEGIRLLGEDLAGAQNGYPMLYNLVSLLTKRVSTGTGSMVD